ncbi:DUF4136 domain-containing protein [Leptospira venezuelensis]|uniref:DUF4136 domain-containing protein n=1 Tax=Leptospira venezuelensis TaxID=1958811 RepID=UPI000A37AAF9|nr:DUF4136 domain-containing protein [Leptospira venezuelensis]
MVGKKTLTVFMLCGSSMLFNCVTAMTRTNTVNTNAPLKGNYSIQYQSTDPQQGIIAKMLSVKLKKIGLIENKENADYHFNMTASITLKGSVKHGLANAVGTNMATVHVSSVPLYSKSLSITINDKKQSVLWTGNVQQEADQCSILGVTMPELITAMFENYPSDLMNRPRKFYLGNSEVGEIKEQFPNMDWSCY